MTDWMDERERQHVDKRDAERRKENLQLHRRKMLEAQGYGLALEGLANLDDDPSHILQRDYPKQSGVKLRRSDVERDT